MRRTVAIAVTLAACVASGFFAPASAIAQMVTTAQRAHLVRSLITLGNLSRIDREKADEREFGLIAVYEERIRSANRRLAALDLTARNQRALNARESAARKEAEAALEGARAALADLAERLASSNRDWAEEREALRALIEQRVAAATPEMAAALQRFADGERVEANRIIEHLENIQVEVRYAAARAEQVAMLRERAFRRQIMSFNREMQAADIVQTLRELIAIAPEDLDAKLEVAIIESFDNQHAQALADLDLAARSHSAVADSIRICDVRSGVLDRAGDLAAAFDLHQACLGQARAYAAAQQDDRLLRATLDSVVRMKAYAGGERKRIRFQLAGENVAAVRAARDQYESLEQWRTDLGVRLSRMCKDREEDMNLACEVEALDQLLAGSTVDNPNIYRIGQALADVLLRRACAANPAPACQAQADRVVEAFTAAKFYPAADAWSHESALMVLGDIARWQVQTKDYGRAIATYRLMLANMTPIIPDDPGGYRVNWDFSQIHADLATALTESGDVPEALRACDALLEVEGRAFAMSAAGSARSSRMAGAYSSNARCHADRDDEPGSLSPLRKAVEAWRVSTRAAPADELELALFIDGLATLAEAELSEGDPRAAWPLFSEAIAKLRPRAFGPRDPDGIEAGRLAELEERLARGLAHDEQLSRADAEYLRAIAIRERLDRLPDPRGRRFDDLTDLLWEYGEFQAQAGRSPAAATTLKRSVEVSRLAASRSSPRQAAARESYGQRLGEYGAWLVSRNDLAGAAIAFRLRIDLVRELLTIEKAGIIPSDLAEAYVALSAVEVKLGKQDDALAGYRAAFDILSQEAAARGYRKSLRRDLNAAFDGLTSLYLARSSVIDLGAISASVLPIREQYFARYADDEGIRADLAVTLLTLGIVKRATGALPAAKDYLARCVMLAAQSILTGDSRKAIDAIGAACQAQLTPPAAGAPG